MIIDVRSDTFTKPTPAMLQAMMNTSVGDDVFGEDPTVNELEQKVAALFGMESALFCPSGTMTNQIAIKCHTEPGNEVICDKTSHVYIYEGGGIAFNSACQVQALHGDRGRLNASQILAAINPDDIHKPPTALVSLENTANRGGGSCYAWQELLQIKKVCTENNLKLHLDGARLWNALVAKQETPHQYGQLFDSISVCLSKGLGAPVGSLVLGKTDFIKKARRIRKIFGGGMRQAGYLAAAGIYALDHHVERLQIYHQHALIIADALQQCKYVKNILPVETNIILFDTLDDFPAAKFVETLAKNGIKAMALAPQQVRFVTHLDISEEMVAKLVKILIEMQ
ncbi:MAG: DegT/DnrJ/EryC1/StrS family aminotransferase [Bacteroidetes bacterium]|nr:DegT/DnrJ/EryC1/StrS family aminotransferase [Bacteroidota bacterium]